MSPRPKRIHDLLKTISNLRLIIKHLRADRQKTKAKQPSKL